MIAFQKLFLNGVVADHQEQLVSFLGLREEHFVFREELPGYVLRLIQCDEKGFRLILNDQVQPSVVFKHPTLVSEKAPEDKSLVNWLLPFPWSHLVSNSKLKNGYFEFFDNRFQSRCEQLAAVFSDLETLLVQHEVSGLLMKTEEKTDAFFFHAVRGKIIRISFIENFQQESHSSDWPQTSWCLVAMKKVKTMNLNGFSLALELLSSALKSSVGSPLKACPKPVYSDVPLQL